MGIQKPFKSKIKDLRVRKLTARERFLSLVALCLMGVLAFRASVASMSCQHQQDGSELCSILVDMLPAERLYQYEIRRAVDGAPTVIVLPGGPGQGVIGDIETLAMVQLIPAHFGVIAIDPRGVGKNDFGADPSGSLYTSENVARDVYEVIRRENLQEYLIYGESYGTVVATHLAHLVTQERPGKSIPALPKAVVLSRVIGEGFQDQVENYNQQLQRILKEFSADKRALIQSGLKNIYYTSYAGNDSAFSGALMQALLFNVEAKNPGPLSVRPSVHDFFKALALKKELSQNAVFQMLAQTYNRNKDPFEIRPIAATRSFAMDETIQCQELSSTAAEARIAFDFHKLKLVLVQSDCKLKGISMSRPFHSWDYQISRVPVIYLNGNIDPATPTDGAHQHYLSQRTRNKIFIEMKGFAHVGSIGLWNCREGLWNAFTKGTSFVRNHFLACSDPQITVVDPSLQSAETKL